MFVQVNSTLIQTDTTSFGIGVAVVFWTIWGILHSPVVFPLTIVMWKLQLWLYLKDRPSLYGWYRIAHIICRDCWWEFTALLQLSWLHSIGWQSTSLVAGRPFLEYTLQSFVIIANTQFIHLIYKCTENTLVRILWSWQWREVGIWHSYVFFCFKDTC